MATKTKNQIKDSQTKLQVPACNKARDKFLDYIANKFTFKQQKQFYKRFLIEAQAAWAEPTSGILVSVEESRSYNLDGVRKALQPYKPAYQKKLLFEYIKDVLPTLEKNFDIGADEAFLIAMFQGIQVAATFETCVNLLHKESVKFIEGLTKRMKDRAKKRSKRR